MIGTLAKAQLDVEFIVDKFFGPKTRQAQMQTQEIIRLIVQPRPL
jgi:hypothetical protein